MELKIKIYDNSINNSILKKKNIPCVIRIGAKGFEVVFSDLLFNDETIGTVSNYDFDKLSKRISIRVGGKYTLYSHAMITLKKCDSDIFKVLHLYIFDIFLGWEQIIHNGEYAQLHHYRKAIASRENEIETEMFLCCSSNESLLRSLFLKLNLMDAELLNSSTDELSVDNKLHFQYFQFDLFVKIKGDNVYLEGPKGIIKEMIGRLTEGK